MEDGRNGTQAASQNGSLTAPDYHTVPANANIAPPDYRDALHDVIVPEGEQQAPPDYSEVCVCVCGYNVCMMFVQV